MNLVTTISKMLCEFFAIEHNSTRKIFRIVLYKFYIILINNNNIIINNNIN